MAQRRFGPTLGAGVVIVEKESDKPISIAQLGITAYTGILEKGPVDKLFLCSTKSDFLRRAGSYIPESLIPDCAFDFFNLGNGKGELWLQRLTDGTGKKASVTLYNRKFPEGAVLKVEADNVGRWGGKYIARAENFTSAGTNTLTTGLTLLKNEWKGGFITLNAAPGKSYEVLSNTTAGVLTFAGDVNLTADLGGSPDTLYGFVLANGGKALSVQIEDGEDDPVDEFAMNIFIDGVRVKRYANLSMDPNSAHYVEKTINEDLSNFDIKVEDLNTGAVVSSTRPANVYAKSTVATATQLKFAPYQAITTSPGNTVGVVGSVTLGGSIIEDTLTLTCLTPGPLATFSVLSAQQGALPNLTEGTPYVTNQFSLNFTLTSTGPAFAAADTVVIQVRPLKTNALVDGYVIADHVNFRRTKFRIVSNTADTINVATGSDLLTVAAVADEFLVSYPEELGGGYDGIEDLVDASYIAKYDTGTSYLNQLFGKNKGLVKLATPGVTSTAVQKAGLAYAEAKNYQYRVEIPSTVVLEQDAEAYINDTIGRNDFGKVHFPSYAEVSNPLGEGLKMVSLTGAIHGREAKIANDFGGYHKIAGGIDVTLPNVLRLPTLDRVLNEELLNPQGINVVKFKEGNAIMWGARSISLDPAYKFVQKREQLSFYENIFRESFDFIIFALNNAETRERLKASFNTFFLPEFAKGAITGNTYDDAVSIKIDDENNTLVSMAAGDLNAEIKVRIADTVERFIITIGQAGIFEDLG